jgi:hypothetical protein
LDQSSTILSSKVQIKPAVWAATARLGNRISESAVRLPHELFKLAPVYVPQVRAIQQVPAPKPMYDAKEPGQHDKAGRHQCHRMH